MSNKKEEENKVENSGKKVCGLVMPISKIDNCDEKHWSDVRMIIETVVSELRLEVNLVSASNESGLIHDRIVSNLYENDIVICDVSCKNPNVMFELGLRLAFDKATIIIKDDVTQYSFDTANIEHLEYPRDLNYHKINAFCETLKRKITATLIATEEENYSMFLKHFPGYIAKKREIKTITGDELTVKRLDNIDQTLWNISESISKINQIQSSVNKSTKGLYRDWTSPEMFKNGLIYDIVRFIRKYSEKRGVTLETLRDDPFEISKFISEFKTETSIPPNNISLSHLKSILDSLIEDKL